MKSIYTALIAAMMLETFVATKSMKEMIADAKQEAKDANHMVMPSEENLLKKFIEPVDSDETEQDPLFTIPILNITNFDLFHFAEGFASGIYNRDVRGQYDQCVLGLPNFGLKLYDAMIGLEITSFADLMGEWSKLMAFIPMIQSMIAEAPEDISACEAIYSEGAETVTWIIHHLSITQMFANILSNVATNIVGLSTDVWMLFSDMLKHDFYKTGKDMGKIIMLLLN